MEDLNSLFRIKKKVIFDDSLNESYKERLKQECEQLGVAYVDMDGTTSYAVLLKRT